MHRLDQFVANENVVELKAVKGIADVHFAVVRSYLRATGRKHGLILNFAKPTLEAKRVLAPTDPSCTSSIPWRLLSSRAVVCGARARSPARWLRSHAVIERFLAPGQRVTVVVTGFRNADHGTYTLPATRR